MTSKKTYCTDCGKEIFRTRAEANLALQNMRSRHKTCGSVYRCKACGGFHLTHLGYREGRRRYRSKSSKKDGTKDGTIDGTMILLSHKIRDNGTKKI